MTEEWYKKGNTAYMRDHGTVIPSPVHSKCETVETEGDTKRYYRRNSQVQEL